MAMDTLRSTAHLQREIGDELFAALISSDNTEAVQKFAETLIKSALPTQMTIAGRTYDILGFLKGDEKCVGGNVMVAQAKEMQANLGEEDGQHILKHQDEIPAAFRGKVIFVFTDWRCPDDSRRVADLYWGDDRWCQRWRWLDFDWDGRDRLLRRK